MNKVVVELKSDTVETGPASTRFAELVALVMTLSATAPLPSDWPVPLFEEYELATKTSLPEGAEIDNVQLVLPDERTVQAGLLVGERLNGP